jgi:hypothetical protein
MEERGEKIEEETNSQKVNTEKLVAYLPLNLYRAVRWRKFYTVAPDHLSPYRKYS